MLRRRVFLLYALVKLREGKFDKAHAYVERARSKLGSDLPDRTFATDCDTRQAEIFEYAEDLEQAKLTVHRALAFYEENHIKNIHHADALRCMARIDRAEGKLDLAVSNFQKSIEQAKDIFGKDNPVLAPYYFDLGKTYLEYEPMKLDKALEPLQNASKLGTLLFKRFRPTDDECLDLETYKFQEGLAQQKKAMKTLVPGTTNMLDELPP
jgi:tetratricopeptide (TPR) repeat protein